MLQPSLELSHPGLTMGNQGSSNEGSQHIVSFRNKKNYPELSSKTQVIWRFGPSCSKHI